MIRKLYILITKVGYRVRFLVFPIRNLTGISCQTCGVTCSFMAISQEIWFKQWQKI
nr:DUF2752 domain-containing protein [Nostoc edaphicum]